MARNLKLKRRIRAHYIHYVHQRYKNYYFNFIMRLLWTQNLSYLIRDLFYRNINNFQVITNNVDVEDDTPRLFNLYRNRKLLSHGLMDVALFSANANQLRYVLEGSDGNAISVICVALLLISILLQVST